jgi:hypothetical protein
MNKVPAMVGTIERRLLINYRVAAEALEGLLPSPFRPQLIDGVGMAGICLIRLGHLRPVGVPAALGVTSENAAHRIAVEWDGPDGRVSGVYIPRRDTSSQLTVLLGGRLFPGEHHRSHFQVSEAGGDYEVAFRSVDGTAKVAIRSRAAPDLGSGSIFSSLDTASTFFEAGSLGYSATHQPDRFEGLELHCATWHVEPLLVEHAQSSFFEDESLFPKGAVKFDSALIMRKTSATWRAREPLTSKRHVGDPGLAGVTR